MLRKSDFHLHGSEKQAGTPATGTALIALPLLLQTDLLAVNKARTAIDQQTDGVGPLLDTRFALGDVCKMFVREGRHGHVRRAGHAPELSGSVARIAGT